MKKNNTVQTHRLTSIRTYRFEFGTDEKLHTVSFKGILSEQETRNMLESLHNTLYEECGEAIRLYLDSHNLEYSAFKFCWTFLEHDTVITVADSLLRSDTCEDLDGWIGDADEYYGIIDHQRQVGESCFEGCRFAVSRVLSKQLGGCYVHHVIGQTFQYNLSNGSEQSYFAIRNSQGSHCLHTLDSENRYPVLAVFGCTDVMALILDIDSITTLQQAADLANR